MKHVLALVLAAAAGLASAVTATRLYDHPTFDQFERAIAAAEGRPYVPTPARKTDPTFDQMERLISAIKAGGSGLTNAVTLAAFTYATNMLTQAKVGTNDFAVATNGLRVSKRDTDDLAVYRKVKDIWTWTNYTSNQWSTAEAPSDFLEVANSPGTIPLQFRGGDGGSGGWYYANQYWPNGNLKYDQGYAFSGDLAELSTNLYFAFTAYAEDGRTELFRFGAKAHRESATDETVTNWFDFSAANYPVRLVTTDLLAHAIRFDKSCGSARILPEYLWKAEFSDSYEQDAYRYYDEEDGNASDDRTPGLCSARRIGALLERNYDWYRDNAAEFVVLTDAGPGRFASAGIANIGERLTEELVSSGKPSWYYKCLPGRTVDGVNENGVAINVNVVVTNGSKWEVSRGVDGRDIDSRWAVRFVLDHATDAKWAATNLAARVYVSKALRRMGYSVHYAIVDRDSTWLVEDGEAYPWNAHVESIITNFRIMTPDGHISQMMSDDPYGAGYERYGILKQGGLITDVWYSNAYRRDADGNFPWPTEFAGQMNGLGRMIVNTNTVELQAWARENIPSAIPDKAFPRGAGLWQTVHTSVYDISNLTLRVAVQEKDDWYSFSVPGVVRGIPEVVRQDEVSDDTPYGKAADARDLRDRLASCAPDPTNPVFSNAVNDASAESKFTTWVGGYATAGRIVPDVTARWSPSNVSYGDCHAMAYGNGRLVAGTWSSSMRYSDNGITWTESVIPTATGNCHALAYGNGRFVAGFNGSDPRGHGIWYSNDGVTWTVSGKTDEWWGALAYGDGMFVAASDHSGIWYSNDGVTWANGARADGSWQDMPWKCVAYGNGRFVAGSGNSWYSEGIVYSDDGVTWTQSSVVAGGPVFVSMAYGDGMFVAGSTSSGIWRSSDGISWERVDSTVSGGDWLSLAYDNGLFVAGNGSSGVWYSRDAVTWSQSGMTAGWVMALSFAKGRCVAGTNGSGIWYSASSTVDKFVPIVQGVRVDGVEAVRDGGNVVDIQTGSARIDAEIARATAAEGLLAESIPVLDPVVTHTDGGSFEAVSHVITTWLPASAPPHTVEMVPTGTRNYKVFLPNQPSLRSGLPFELVTDAEGARLGIAWTNEIERLPALVEIMEPVSGTLIGRVTYFDTDFDWSPAVSSAAFDGTLLRVSGERLHGVMSVRVGGTTAAVAERTYSLVSAPIEASVGDSGALLDKDGNEIGTFEVTE